MATALTDEQIERLNSAFSTNGGKVREAARRVGVSVATASKYIDRERYNPPPPEVEAVRTQKRLEIAEKFGDLQVALIDALMDKTKIEKASYQELANTLGIATEKRLLITGQPTSRNETIATDPAAKLTPDEMEAAARIRAKLAAEAS